jgi:hypothetical protein
MRNSIYNLNANDENRNSVNPDQINPESISNPPEILGNDHHTGDLDRSLRNLDRAFQKLDQELDYSFRQIRIAFGIYLNPESNQVNAQDPITPQQNLDQRLRNIVLSQDPPPIEDTIEVSSQIINEHQRSLAQRTPNPQISANVSSTTRIQRNYRNHNNMNSTLNSRNSY